KGERDLAVLAEVPLPFRLGLKFFSINIDLLPQAIALWEAGLFDYIELYAIPGTHKETCTGWQQSSIPFVIHAPHSFHGVNLAMASCRKDNHSILTETLKFSDDLAVEKIIVHGGHSGSIEETIEQVASLRDDRIFLENKPKVGLHDELCVGWSPEEFRFAQQSEVFAGFVLDFGHATCAARSLLKEPMEMINEFLSLDPQIFHLVDGNRASEKDIHNNLGRGDFDLSRYALSVPEKTWLTLETPRESLDDFVDDVIFLHKLIGESWAGNSWRACK
ncbi:MAG: hypothetical protein WCV64_01960, partial [Desulfurivibrionaceae bacterium]